MLRLTGLKHPPLKNIRVVCIGDSQTSFNGKSLKEVNDESNWTVLVGRQMGIEVINAGISGNSSAQLLARFQTDVIARKPDICIIEEGGNDPYNSVPVSTTISNISQMVAMAKQNNIIPMIMPCTPQFNCAKFYQVHGFSPVIQWENALQQIRQEEQQLCAQQGIQYIDVYTPALIMPGVQDLTQYVTYDEVHPNTKGYQVIAKAVIDALQEVI